MPYLDIHDQSGQRTQTSKLLNDAEQSNLQSGRSSRSTMQVNVQGIFTSSPSGLTAKHGSFVDALKASIFTPTTGEVTLPSSSSSMDAGVTITNPKYNSKPISALSPVFHDALLGQVHKEQTKNRRVTWSSLG